METTVINIKRTPDFDPVHNPNDVYIGRFHQSPKYGTFKASKWRNPFKVGVDGTTEEVLVKYQRYLSERKDLLEQLDELRGKRMGCWCKGEHACHGDVLEGLLRG
jgi:hypothetical protein